MTAAQTRILDLFRALSPSERDALMPSLLETVEADELFDGLRPEQVAAIEEGLAQMRRGETIPADEFFDRLAKKFGFSRS